jgi:hypothetical protein
MPLTLPYPTQPASNSALASAPVLANITAIAQAIQAFDGSQINAGSVSASVFATSINPNTILHDTIASFVQSGCVWSATSGLMATMTGGTIYTGTSSAFYRVIVNGIGSHTFAASSDTYIDIDYNGNVYYVAVANGATTGMTLTANSVRVAKVVTGTTTVGSVVQTGTDPLGNYIYNLWTIPVGGVTAAALSTSAITLGYAQITSNFSTTSTTYVQVTGLTTTVTIPAGNRHIKITAYCGASTNTGAGVNIISIWDGPVNSGTQLAQANGNGNTGANINLEAISVVTPPAGSKTYNVGFEVTSGPGVLGAVAIQPAFILVEAI